jgi:ribosomal protein S18 acetylase RimI-like enzyme
MIAALSRPSVVKYRVSLTAWEQAMNTEGRNAGDPGPARSWTIRPMSVADLPAVRELWKVTPGVGTSPSDSVEGLSKILARNPQLSQVAVDGQGRLIGAVLCGHDAARGYIRHLAVAAGCRGQGLGRELVERCLEGLRALGLYKCTIFVLADNPRGRVFWERGGWKGRPDLQVMQMTLRDDPME